MVRRFFAIAFVAVGSALIGWSLWPRGYVSTAVALFDLPPDSKFERQAAIEKVKKFVADFDRGRQSKTRVVPRGRPDYISPDNVLCCFELTARGPTPQAARESARDLLVGLIDSNLLRPIFPSPACPPTFDCSRTGFQPLEMGSRGRDARFELWRSLRR